MKHRKADHAYDSLPVAKTMRSSTGVACSWTHMALNMKMFITALFTEKN